jgi:hypothetical protein
MRSCRSLLVVLAVALWALSHAHPVAAQPQQASLGRYQLVPLPQGTMFLVDTATGRIWRFSELTGKDVSSYCRGMTSCFYEVDRLKLVGEGWVSEITTPKPTQRKD